MMLRGNRNTCKSKFNGVTSYRSKDKALEQRSYQLYPDIGLLQANITWAQSAWGGDYYWKVALLNKFKITLTPAMLMFIRKLTLLRAWDLAVSTRCLKYHNEITLHGIVLCFALLCGICIVYTMFSAVFLVIGD